MNLDVLHVTSGRDYEMELVGNINIKPKAFWQYVNTRIKTRPIIDELCRPDNTTTSCPEEMAKLFNNYFSSVFTQEDLSSTLPLQLNDQAPPIATFSIPSQSVFYKLTSLKGGKSPGPDGWPTHLLKLMAESTYMHSTVHSV